MAHNCIFVLTISSANPCSVTGWWPQRYELSRLAWDVRRDGIQAWAAQSRLPSVTREKSELWRQVRWTPNRWDQQHGRSTHSSMDQEPRWRWCQLCWAPTWGETKPGQALSHAGCQRKRGAGPWQRD